MGTSFPIFIPHHHNNNNSIGAYRTIDDYCIVCAPSTEEFQIRIHNLMGSGWSPYSNITTINSEICHQFVKYHETPPGEIVTTIGILIAVTVVFVIVCDKLFFHG
jgi:hypothetical protein